MLCSVAYSNHLFSLKLQRRCIEYVYICIYACRSEEGAEGPSPFAQTMAYLQDINTELSISKHASKECCANDCQANWVESVLKEITRTIKDATELKKKYDDFKVIETPLATPSCSQGQPESAVASGSRN